MIEHLLNPWAVGGAAVVAFMVGLGVWLVVDVASARRRENRRSERMGLPPLQRPRRAANLAVLIFALGAISAMALLVHFIVAGEAR
jgi:predicted lysophospholipase L1 biosynthesis ABC-type transport system permease subunit